MSEFIESNAIPFSSKPHGSIKVYGSHIVVSNPTRPNKVAIDKYNADKNELRTLLKIDGTSFTVYDNFVMITLDKTINITKEEFEKLVKEEK